MKDKVDSMVNDWRNLSHDPSATAGVVIFPRDESMSKPTMSYVMDHLEDFEFMVVGGNHTLSAKRKLHDLYPDKLAWTAMSCNLFWKLNAADGFKVGQHHQAGGEKGAHLLIAIT